MVEQRICSFCGTNIEPGTGRLFVKKDGVTYNFCSSKCFKNQIGKRKVPRMTEWTAAHKREKEISLGSAKQEKRKVAKKVTRKTRKVKAPKEKSKEKSPKDAAEEPKREEKKPSKEKAIKESGPEKKEEKK